jgi:hypothetical protein
MFRVVDVEGVRPAPSAPGWFFRGVKGSTMKRVNQYQFFQLGSVIHPLTDISRDETMGDVLILLLSAQNWLEYMSAGSIIPLTTCRSVMGRLLAALQRSIPHQNMELPTQERQADWSKKLAAKLTWYEVSEIPRLAKEFETVLAAELETTDTYYVSEKGIYSTSKLIESAELLFSPSVRNEMPDKAIADVRQAGKCLAFDMDTASGFHMVRATETMIHKYYETVTGSALRRKDRNWGAYVRNLNTHLKNNPTSRIDRKLVVLIDQVREHHRNPVMHPEITLDSDEAQSLFSICQAIIVTFANALRLLGGQSMLQAVSPASKP